MMRLPLPAPRLRADNPLVCGGGPAHRQVGQHREAAMLRRLLIIAAIALLVIVRPAWAQAPSADTTVAAKELIETMRAADQFKMMVPMLLQQLKPAIVQGRSEVERDYDAVVPQMLALFDARMGEFVAAIAGVYAT